MDICIFCSEHGTTLAKFITDEGIMEIPSVILVEEISRTRIPCCDVKTTKKGIRVIPYYVNFQTDYGLLTIVEYCEE